MRILGGGLRSSNCQDPRVLLSSRQGQQGKRAAYVVNRATSAPSPDEWYSRSPEFCHVDFLPRVLVSTYDHAWVVSIKQ